MASLIAFGGGGAAGAGGGPFLPGLHCASAVGQAELSWKKQQGVTDYAVFRLTDGVFSQIATTTDGSFRDTTAEPNRLHRYGVREASATGQPWDLNMCTAGSFELEELPLLGPPEVQFDDRSLLTFAGPDPARTEYGIKIEIRGVPTDGWQAQFFVDLVSASNDQLVLELSSDATTLQPGDTTYQAQVQIDALADDLPAGFYTVQSTVIVAPELEAPVDLAQAQTLLQRTVQPATVFISSSDDSLEVLDEGLDEVAGFMAAIESGNPDTAYKGMSALLTHYRAREMYADAELTVNQALETHDELRDMRHIYRLWNVDDRRLAGNPTGAAQLLIEVIDEAPADALFLGEPFRARGLMELARLYTSQGDWSSTLATYQDLAQSFPTFHTPTVLSFQAEAHLWLGQFQEAQQVLEELVQSAETCEQNRLEGGAVCPAVSQVHEAEDVLEILQSGQDWFRQDPQELIDVFRDAIAQQDIEILESILPVHGIQFVMGAWEWNLGRWSSLRRFVIDALTTSPQLRVGTPSEYGRRLTFMLENISAEADAGPSNSVGITLVRTPFGWQWDGVDGIAYMAPEGEWDPCTLDTDGDGLPNCQEPPPPTPPTGGTPRLAIQAPWAPGSHMRAGGLQGSIPEAVIDAASFIIPRFDRCGAGVPGYLYGLDTHTNEDHYAIDYTQGSNLFCIRGHCVPMPLAITAELIQIAADQIWSTPTKTPAYDDPVMAAREGLVVQRIFDFDDGDNDSSHANKVGIAVWSDEQPESITRLARVMEINSGWGLGTTLRNIGSDYFLRYLHLRKTCKGACPSRGMWVYQGQKVGLIDDTGKSFTSHLHFVVRKRPADEGDAGTVSRWESAVQMIDGDYISGHENGKCIKSKNELNWLDSDADGIFDHQDNCRVVPNPEQHDADLDMVGDACDTNTCLPNGIDSDGDGDDDSCDPDIDDDGVPNEQDQCPYFDDGVDTDGDGIADGCDLDIDGDGFNEQACEPDWAMSCGCLVDLFPDDPTKAGDHDEDGIDSRYDSCPCDSYNPGCGPLIDLPPPGLNGAAASEWGEPYDPTNPWDPYGGGGSPYGPGGDFP